MKTRDLTAGQIIERVDEILELRYRSADLGNLLDPLDETVFILLSRQTRDTVYRRVFGQLRNRYPRWLDVLGADLAEVERILAPAGLHRQRAKQLYELLKAVAKANEEREVGPSARVAGDLTLDFLNDLDDAAAERFLVSLPGIGKKSARCVLAYALDRPAFAVDTHVHRIFSRLNLTESQGRKADHDPYQNIVPQRLRKRLHINLVHHGRAVCRTENPVCSACPLVSFCQQGQERISAASTAPVAIDLFAGAGGLGFGFGQAGFRVALAVEADRHAAQTYRLNNPGVPVVEGQLDETTTVRSLRRHMPGVSAVTAVLAGPPCQGYSSAGSRDPEDVRNTLYRHVARLAKGLRAEIVVLEQVPGVRRVNGHGFLNTIRDCLRKAGYATDAHLVHACEFGVPQHRARYLFLGRRRTRRFSKPPPAPISTHTAHAESASPPAGLATTPSLLDVLSQIPPLGAGSRAEYHSGPDGIRYFNMSTMKHTDRVIAKIEAIGPGAGPISYRRLETREARTLIAGHRALPVHPRLHRSISVREAALIQGFPLGYIFCGPPAEQPLQVANAVAPPLARAIASQLLNVINDREPEGQN